MYAHKLTVSLPCYGRPQRTKRAIECILNQNVNDWEAFIMGDGCPYFQKMIDDGFLEKVKKKAAKKGNTIHYFNNKVNTGGYGYVLTNLVINEATGKYLIFYANDDIILPNHCENYLEIEKKNLDFMYFDTWIDPIQQKRNAVLAPSQIGHSEIILKTELAKRLSNHSSHYGHDWDFIDEMRKKGRGMKSLSQELTYHVMHVPNFGTRDIID